MKQPRLSFYTIDLKYVRKLAHVDDNVMSISPQSGKSTRPFVGIIVICENRQYCVPLSSPKPKHDSMPNDVDFMKIHDGNRLIGVLNFNNMIPVNDLLISKIDLRLKEGDTQAVVHYKKLMVKQLTFCQKNQDAIVRKANRLYQLIISGKANHLLRRRCCNFSELESALEKLKP